jgi:FAD-dependent urate hydroxylase
MSPSSTTDCRVGIIGAGPHGLAAAAYLRAAGIETTSFGDVMRFWRDNMPEGMLLRSAIRATNIASPDRSVSLERWAREAGRELSFPLPLQDFRDYAGFYQRQLVSEIDPRMVSEVKRADGGFSLRLDDGDHLRVDTVAVAAGIAPFPRIPDHLRSLPASLMSHSSEHSSLSAFRNRRVAVLGSGQSALESAALLSEAGADVEMIFRAGAVRWLTGPTPARKRLYWPSAPTDICGPRSSWLTAAPDMFRRFPSRLRERLRGCAGPAGGHWLRGRMDDIPMHAERTITRASADSGRIRLELSDGTQRDADHLLLGTGYEVDVRRYQFLAPELANSIETVNGYPVLGPGLESSVAGLHFLGAPAAHTFGPVMRFVTGTWYTAPALTARVLGRRQPPLRWAF